MSTIIKGFSAKLIQSLRLRGRLAHPSRGERSSFFSSFSVTLSHIGHFNHKMIQLYVYLDNIYYTYISSSEAVLLIHHVERGGAHLLLRTHPAPPPQK